MLKAVIFDDEFIVLKGLERMIDWETYGIELVGTATDGEQALQLFREKRPDIVFTDIRMPVIDGLQVIEEIKKEAPETECIVFSGFNEFTYVKKALKLGVVDYLEKPITIPTFLEALEKTIGRIEEKESISSLKHTSERQRVETATLAFLSGQGEEHDWLSLLGLNEDAVKGVTILALSMKLQPSIHSADVLLISLQVGRENLLVVCHLKENIDETWAQLYVWASQQKIAVGAGRTYASVNDLSKSYKEALLALRYSQFMNEGEWYHYEEIGENPDHRLDMTSIEDSIMFQFKIGNTHGLLEELQRLEEEISQKRPHPNVLERDLLKLVYMGLEFLKESGYRIREIWPGYMPHVEIRELHSKQEMLEWLRVQLERMIEVTNQVRATTKHEAVEKACSFIQAHYTKDVTLQEVSEVVGMNPTYFSHLFKEEMGQSYIKYLTGLRMEKAKLLLKEGKKVAEVSALVGYHSYRHFTELFKKHVGQSPGQFRE